MNFWGIILIRLLPQTKKNLKQLNILVIIKKLSFLSAMTLLIKALYENFAYAKELLQQIFHQTKAKLQ